MFESLSLLTLQQYWWIIISLLGAILVFLMFVQGGQTLIFQLGKTENEKKMLVNSLGRKWEFTFTTLVTFRRSFFCLLPVVLFDKLRRRLLGMDRNTLLLYHPGGFV